MLVPNPLQQACLLPVPAVALQCTGTPNPELMWRNEGLRIDFMTGVLDHSAKAFALPEPQTVTGCDPDGAIWAHRQLLHHAAHFTEIAAEVEGRQQSPIRSTSLYATFHDRNPELAIDAWRHQLHPMRGGSANLHREHLFLTGRWGIACNAIAQRDPQTTVPGR